MNSRAWYWVAAGVLAMGLNSEYQHGGLKWAHRSVDRGREVANCLEASSHRYLAMARLMFGADPAPEFPTEVVLAQVQEQVADAQEKIQDKQFGIDKVTEIHERIEPAMIRAQVAMEKAQIKINMAQMKAEMRANRAYMCPRMEKMTFVVPDVPNVKVPRVSIPKVTVRVPQVDVDLSDVPGISEDDSL